MTALAATMYTLIPFSIIPKTQAEVQCGETGITAQDCSNCPEMGEWACTSATCTWMYHTNLCRESFSDEIRTASVHLVYDKPPEVWEPAWWFQELVVKASSDATSFTTNGQNFGFGSVLQLEGEPRMGRVMFSISDLGCNVNGFLEPCVEASRAKTISCGTGITCEEVENGQSSGQMSYFDSHQLPSLDDPYYFVTYAKPIADGVVDYSGFFYGHVFSSWKFLSRIRISTGRKAWWHGGMISSVEQQAPIKATHDRSGLFGPSFMSDLTSDASGMSFFQIPSAYFSFGLSENHEHINAWAQNGALGIATGGDNTQTVSKWTRFTYPPAKRPPALHAFAEKIPCLNNAVTTKEIEDCLSIGPSIS